MLFWWPILFQCWFINSGIYQGEADTLRNIGAQICKKIVFGFWMDSSSIEFYENSIQSFRASVHSYSTYINSMRAMVSPQSLLGLTFGLTWTRNSFFDGAPTLMDQNQNAMVSVKGAHMHSSRAIGMFSLKFQNFVILHVMQSSSEFWLCRVSFQECLWIMLVTTLIDHDSS